MPSSANIPEVSRAKIRIIATILREDIQAFRLAYRRMVEQAASGVNVSSQLVSSSQATQAGTQAGNHIASGAQQAISSHATQTTAPIASTGPSVGRSLATGVVTAFLAKISTGLLKKGLEEATKIDSASGNLQAALGLTPEQAKQYGKIAGDIYGQAYGDSMESVNEAIGSVLNSIPGMENASNSAVESMTKKVLTLSAAFGTDVPRSAQILGQLVSNGLVKDASDGADLITGVMQKVPTNLRDDVLDAFDEYGPFLHQLGYTGEQAGELILSSVSKGAYGIDKINDALKEFTVRGADLSASSVTALEALKLDPHEIANGVVKGGQYSVEATNKVIKALEAVKDPATQSNLAISLFGTQLEDLGTGSVPQFLKQIQTTGSALGDIKGKTDEASNALGGTMESQLESLKRQFGQTLGQIALPLLQALLPIMKTLANFVNENKDAIVAWGGPLLIIATIVSTIGFAVTAFGIAAQFLGPILGTLTTATFAWNASLLASPITWWVIGIGFVIAAVVLLITHFNEVKEVVANVVNWIVAKFNWLTQVLHPILSTLGAVFQGGNFGGSVSLTGVPGMATGGLVKASPGGSMRILGEGGKNEIVYNEDVYNKKTEADTKLINQLTSDNSSVGGSKNQTNNFYVTDPNVIDRKVTQQWNRM